MSTDWVAEERETIINMSDADDTVKIYTAQLHTIRRLLKDPRFTHLAGTEAEHWAEFSIPAKMWNPVTGAKRKGTPQTPEQRAANAERLRAASAAQRAAQS